MSDARSPDRPDRPTSFPGEISRTTSTEETAPPGTSPTISRRTALKMMGGAALAGFVARNPGSVVDGFNRITQQDAPPPPHEFKNFEFEEEQVLRSAFGKGIRVTEHNYAFTNSQDILPWTPDYKPVEFVTPTSPGAETVIFNYSELKPVPGNNELIGSRTPFFTSDGIVRINQQDVQIGQVELYFGGQYSYLILDSDGKFVGEEQQSYVVLDVNAQIGQNRTLGDVIGSLWGSPVDSERHPTNPATGEILPEGQRFYFPLAPYLDLPKPGKS